MTKPAESVIERLRAQAAEFETKRAELQAELQKSFPEMFTELFANFPEIKRISWVQYTPYFNDGEPCTFSVGKINAFSEEEGDDYWEDDESRIADGEAIAAWKCYLETGKFPADFHSYYTEEQAKKRGFESREAYIMDNTYTMPESIQNLTLETLDREVEVAMAAHTITTELSSIPEEFYLGLFGDHKTITITRKGVEVDEYDHD